MMNELHRQIIAAVDSVAGQFPAGAATPAWTRALKIAVGDLGIRHGYEVLAGLIPERPDFQRQWLFDLTWYEGSDSGGVAVPLVLESEWLHDYERLREDFEKLLVAKAKTKVFIFEARALEIDGLMKRLAQSILTYRGGCFGETYLLFCLDLSSAPYRFVRGIIPCAP